MHSGRIARRLAAPIPSQRFTITDIIGHPHITFLIMVSTGHGVGPTSDVLGAGNRRRLLMLSRPSRLHDAEHNNWLFSIDYAFRRVLNGRHGNFGDHLP
jgi:hypothetical protein